MFSFDQLEEFANFDFNEWRKRYMQWISHMKSRILDVFRGIDRDQDGRISKKELIDSVLASSEHSLISRVNEKNMLTARAYGMQHIRTD